jgi:outer membrane protein
MPGSASEPSRSPTPIIPAPTEIPSHTLIPAPSLSPNSSLAQPSSFTSSPPDMPAASSSSPSPLSAAGASSAKDPQDSSKHETKNDPAAIYLRPRIEQSVVSKPFTLRGAVEYAQEFYPNVLKGLSQVRAARRNVTVQKFNEYMPESLFQYQEILASHNKLTQVFFGSPAFPAISGPASNGTTMSPYFFTAGGFSLDWSPLDFGLHKARINMAKTLATLAQAQFASTALDVGLTAANAFLDAVIAAEQVKAAEQNLASFEEFRKVVHAQVLSSLKPGADESLALAQEANAQNDLIRARLSRTLANANLANAMGLGGRTIDINAEGIADTPEPADLQRADPVFDSVPILQAANAIVVSSMAQRNILNKEYYPVFHFLAGFNLRSSGLSKSVGGQSQSANVSGVLPVIPNYQLAVIVNWNFLDIFRLKQEKRIQDERTFQHQQEHELVLQTLQTEDTQSRAKVKAALALAENMPIQVQSAVIATQQAEARYRTGLGSVAQVAQANETLAQSRVQEAIARVGVWRALLSVASVHGDLKPLLAESDKVQQLQQMQQKRPDQQTPQPERKKQTSHTGPATQSRPTAQSGPARQLGPTAQSEKTEQSEKNEQTVQKEI